jgi:hypothetical protein
MFSPTNLEPVAKLLRREQPRVLLVVGSGVSVGATGAPHASWLGLLKHAIEHLITTQVFTDKWGKKLRASLDAAFSPFDLKTALRHAELVERSLSTPDAAGFAEWLRAAFQDLKIQPGRGETLSAIRDLQQAGALLLTTNYDSLLSEVTGLPPVTWEEHAELLRVINRGRAGILHIHGHWQRPGSVVLGSSSYDRIAGDEDFQDALKSLWLEWSWIYAGCGNGLDDPDLGRLLEWGKRWGKAALKGYFLAKADKADALARRPDKPGTLVAVGYRDHADLPVVLRSLLPTAPCWPFVAIDADFALFRSPGSPPTSVPFPSRQEYLDAEVPALAVDADVRARLNQHGWAFILDVASVGKTTLALRMATAPEQRDHPTHYLDFAGFDAEEAGQEATAALWRLARPTSLLILDNVHHQPELARQLWDQWRDRPRESNLLLVATRTHRAVTLAPAQDLDFFEHHANNPAIELRPKPDDLGKILKHLYARVGGARPGPLRIPQRVLEAWHRDYGCALGAFCLATLGRLAEFQRGRWELPLEAASDWVREKWLNQLDGENRENVLCLAVFGGQRLELQVGDEALPYPGKTGQLLRLGLVARTQRGQFGQYERFELREPGWGRLLLAAQIPAVDEEKILFETAARHPTAALSLSSRLRGAGLIEQLVRLWAYLSSTPHHLVKRIFECPVSYVPHLAQAAMKGQQPLIAQRFWEAIEREPDKLAAGVWETSLEHVARFINVAKEHGRDTTPLWEAIEAEPDRLAASARETSLGNIASFLDTAKRHGRDTDRLWAAIEREPDKLAAHAWESPLGELASFLDTAKRHGRDTGRLWAAIERDPDKLAAHAWESPLGELASFLDAAKRHGRDIAPLWQAIEREPDKLAARVWETSLGRIALFLDTANRHGRDIAPLWQAIEADPDRLAARAWETSLEHVARLINVAKEHGRDTTPLWEAIEREPDKLAARVWETSLEHVARFVNVAKEHGRDTTLLWEAIEREPDKLAARVWETSLEHVARLINVAKEHGRDATPLWEAIEREPDKLAARVWETSLEHVARFINVAKEHGRDATPLWEAIEREPDKLAARVWETSLGHLAGFQNIAREHGRNNSAVWEALGTKPEHLSAMAKQASAAELAGFCHHAPEDLVRIALAGLEWTHWDGIPDFQPLTGATWLAFSCGRVGLEDLKGAIIGTLLRRANPQDFPPDGTSLANVAWLLNNAPSGAESLVSAFLDRLCTRKWLGRLFTNAACGRLAKGLGLLVLHQPPQVRERFRNPSLRIRLVKELLRFTDLAQGEQPQVVRLLGCAVLYHCCPN